MAITSIEVPKMARKSKYEYTDADGDAMAEMLDAGQNPGDGPFKKAGEARAASVQALKALDEKDVGVRVFERGKGEFFFALKRGKRQFKGRGNGAKKGGNAKK